VNWVIGEETYSQYWIEQNPNRCSGELAALALSMKNMMPSSVSFSDQGRRVLTVWKE
jgi:hypothetical protein